MNKRAWAMTAPLVVLVAFLVASCGDDSPTGTSFPATLPSVLNADATFTVTHDGSYVTSDSLDAIWYIWPSTSGVVSIGRGNSRATIVLSELFVAQLAPFGDIEKCFPKTGGQRAFGAGAGFYADQRGRANGAYVFQAYARDGVATAGYALEVEGTFTTTGAAFVPGPEKTTTVTWTHGLLHTDGAVPASGACVGGGDMHGIEKTVNITGSVTIVGN